MKTRLYTLILMGSIFPLIICASTDSLEHKLRLIHGKDRTSLLLRLCKEKHSEDQIFHYINLLEQEATKQNDKKLQMQAMGMRIQAFANINQTDSVIKYAAPAIEFTRKEKEYRLMFSLQDLLIGQLAISKQFSIALKKVKDQFNEAKQLDNPIGMAIANKNLGMIYRSTGRSSEAPRFYEEGIELLEQTNESSLETDLYLDVITLNREQKKDAEALDNCNKCFELLKKRYPNITSDTEKSIFKAQYFTCLCLQACSQIALNSLKEAKRNIDTATKMVSPSWKGIWLYPLWEAQVKYNMAINNYPEALKYHNLMAQYTGNSYLAYLYFTNEKARIYIGLGQYKEACSLYEEAIIIKDSIYSINFASQLDGIRSLYELDKLEMKAEKNKLNMIFLLSGVLTLTIVCILLGIIVFIIRRNSRNLKEKNRSLFLQLKEKDVMLEKIEQLSTLQSPDDTCQESNASPEAILFNRLQQWLITDKKYTNLKITPEEVASKLSTNTRYLYDAIRQMAGQTFNDYINTLKLEYARKLLLNDKMNQITIEGISAEAGFNTRSNFYRLFRLKYGLTPSELRKQGEESFKENS